MQLNLKSDQYFSTYSNLKIFKIYLNKRKIVKLFDFNNFDIIFA